MSKSKIRLAAISYALKMESLLNSKKKLAILSSGGVFKNKKLQKGSTLPLFSANLSNHRETSEFKSIHIFEYLAPTVKKLPNLIINHSSKRKNPFI